jgi:hypothetical protein
LKAIPNILWVNIERIVFGEAALSQQVPKGTPCGGAPVGLFKHPLPARRESQISSSVAYRRLNESGFGGEAAPHGTEKTDWGLLAGRIGSKRRNTGIL